MALRHAERDALMRVARAVLALWAFTAAITWVVVLAVALPREDPFKNR